MIRAEILYDFTRLDGLSSFSDRFATLMKANAARVFNQKIRLGFLAQLRKTPKRRYWTRGDFAKDASRRAFFAKTGGKPYQRTGRLAAGWQVNISTSDNAIAFSASNKVPYEKWVQGEQQVFGHAKTGWGKEPEIFAAWRPRVAQELVDATYQMIQAELAS